MVKRNIEVPVDTWEQFSLSQKSLLERYILIEGLPRYPVSLPLKSSQQLLRNFASRVIMELTEAYEQLTQVWRCLSENNPKGAKLHVEGYNEEIADAFHFMIELLLYSGIDKNFHEFLERFVGNQPEPLVFEIDHRGMRGAFDWADIYNVFNAYKQIYRAHTTMSCQENPQVWEIGGNKLSSLIIDAHAEFLWHFTCSLYYAINLLKYKDWTQSEVKKLNELEYRDALFTALMRFITYLDFANINEESLYHIYMFKNENNHERITNGY